MSAFDDVESIGDNELLNDGGRIGGVLGAQNRMPINIINNKSSTFKLLLEA